jgi:Flp pilus assembly protein TadG
VLVEFALIAIAFYMLMAGTIEVGRMIFSSQLIQNAARVGARELALLPLPAKATFEQAMHDPTLNSDVKEYIYDEALLVWDIPAGATSAEIQDQVNAWPAINRMLYPLMIQETFPAGNQVLHYPGAFVMKNGVRTIAIPQVVGTNAANGGEIIRWHDVVEEISPTAPTAADPHPAGPFSVTADFPVPELRGLVALRINFPFQASTLSAYRHPDGAPPEMRNQVVLANDGNVSSDGIGEPTEFLPHPDDVPSYAGQYGLGKLLVLGSEVRPYSRLLTAQSMFRREVFK